MSGQFKTAGLGVLEATPNTRLELVSPGDNLVAHLSAMTVNHGGVDLFEAKKSKLGQDPLRADADPELVWQSFRKSRKSVGMLLMDQSVIAGLGNIYRAEVLFKAGVHPEQPGNTISEAAFASIWDISKDLLHRGFQTGSILTVDPEENLPAPWTRRYIYNHSSCGRCGTKVRTWDMGGRTCYACPGCQKLSHSAELGQERVAKLRLSKAHVPFKSHCAPDDPARDAKLNALTVKDLRELLKGRGLSAQGKKAALVARLVAAGKEEDVGGDGRRAAEPASALEAALEKVRAGEKRNVEHVALVEESTIALAKATKARASPRRRKGEGIAVGPPEKKVAAPGESKPRGEKLPFRKSKRRRQ